MTDSQEVSCNTHVVPEQVPAILVSSVGAAVLRSPEINFQLSPDGSIAVTAEDVRRLAGELCDGDLVWFRSGTPWEVEGPAPNVATLLDGLIIDYDKRDLELDGTRLNFKKMEYDLLVFLVEHKNVVMSYEEILNEVWGSGYVLAGTDQTIKTHIARIRKKLTDRCNWTIRTSRNVGYIFTDVMPKDITNGKDNFLL
jgi:DNA-binding winged helix-turn-helix (wHTH) protein